VDSEWMVIPRHRLQHEGRRHASRQRMQQELDGVRALVVPEQHRRLAVHELEGLGARAVLDARAEESRGWSRRSRRR
jgi:hypothetical protein